MTKWHLIFPIALIFLSNCLDAQRSNCADPSAACFREIQKSLVIAESGGQTRVSESGDEDHYTVALLEKPDQVLTVAIVFNSDQLLLNGQAKSLEISFSPEDWSEPRLVTVRAIDDQAAEGKMVESITHSVVGVAQTQVVRVEIEDDEESVLIIEESKGSSGAVEGATDSYSLRLTSNPLEPVQVVLESDFEQVSLNGQSETLTLAWEKSDWSEPRTVTVTARDDALAEGNHAANIRHQVISANPQFGDLTPRDVTFQIADNETAGLAFGQLPAPFEVAEGGQAGEYTVVLASQPRDLVWLDILPDEQLLVNGTEDGIRVEFSAENWASPVTISVTARDDAATESNHLGRISHILSSSDSGYDGLFLSDMSVSILDNESPGIQLIQTDGSTELTEGGPADTYSLALTSLPSAPVTITLTPGSQVTVNGSSSPVNLEFTQQNFDTPQNVTVAAVQDNDVENSHNGTITHQAASEDPIYDSVTLNSLFPSITDDDVTPSVQSHQPLHGDSNFLIDGVITVTFATDMDQTVLETPGVFALETGAPAVNVAGMVSYEIPSRTATFTPDNYLEQYKSFTARVSTGAVDTKGNAITAEYSWSFATGPDTIPPEISSFSPADGSDNAYTLRGEAEITVNFNEPVNPLTIDTNTTTSCAAGKIQLSVDDFASCVPMDSATPVASNGNYTFTITPTEHLDMNTVYKIRLRAGVADFEENAISADTTQASGYTTETARRNGDGTLSVIDVGGGTTWKRCSEGTSDGTNCYVNPFTNLLYQFCYEQSNACNGGTNEGFAQSHEAFDACANSTYAGYSDWRLPTKAEMQVWVQNHFRTDKFPDWGTVTYHFWTNQSENILEAWAVTISGSFYGISKDTGARVRCVRDGMVPPPP